MIHGRGQQYWQRKEYQDKRNKMLLDRYSYDEDEQDLHDVSFPDGGGRTDPEVTYEIKQTNLTKAKQTSKKIDIRDVSWYGY